MMNSDSRTHRFGFTLIELLVTMGIIVLLIGLVGAALAKVQSAAKRSQLQQQVNTIVTGLETFEADFQYFPPLLLPEQGVGSEPADINGLEQLYVPEERFRDSASDYTDALESARYNSEYSIAVYLFGIGDLNRDEEVIYDDTGTTGVEPNYDDGLDGPGIRDPGRDKSWGGGYDRLAQDPDASNGYRPATGRVYGPYLDVGAFEEYLLEGEAGSGFEGLYRVVDSFGNPIRYYKEWNTFDSSGNTDVFHVPSELRSLPSLQAQIDGKDQKAFDGDVDLLRWKVAVLAAGAQPRHFEVVDSEQVPIYPFGDRYLDGSDWEEFTLERGNRLDVSLIEDLDDLAWSLRTNVKAGR